MKYFFPTISDEKAAEDAWLGARFLPWEHGYPTSPRRILALSYRGHDDEPRWLQVGLERPETGDIIQAIFRSCCSPYYWVLTACHGLLEGAPLPVPARKGTFAVEFEPKPAAPEDPPA
jgi:hypothetical protein